jgi:hypothetical protein
MTGTVFWKADGRSVYEYLKGGGVWAFFSFMDSSRTIKDILQHGDHQAVKDIVGTKVTALYQQVSDQRVGGFATDSALS